jgi:hypothetical protein
LKLDATIKGAVQPGPDAPSNLLAAATSTSQIKLTWKDNANDNTGIEIDRSADGVNFTPLKTLGDVTTYTDTGLSAGKKYYYRVLATNGALISDPSNIAIATTQSSSTLISTGSTWKYLDNGSNQGTNWRNASFNDSSWKSGKAQLGYGDGDEKTVVKYGPSGSSKYITTYFRKTFTVSDPSQIASLSARMIRDDGAVVYLNGHEVWRSNMPGGTIGYKTLASAGVTGSDESKWFTSSLSKSWLVAGTNVIAVEIHQNVGNSADISFDFELKAVVSAPALSLAAGMPSLFSTTKLHAGDPGILQ